MKAKNEQLLIVVVVGILLMIMAIAAIVVWLVQLLWNNTAVSVCHFATISYWQAFKIIVLVGLIFVGPLGAQFWIGSSKQH